MAPWKVPNDCRDSRHDSISPGHGRHLAIISSQQHARPAARSTSLPPAATHCNPLPPTATRCHPLPPAASRCHLGSISNNVNAHSRHLITFMDITTKANTYLCHLAHSRRRRDWMNVNACNTFHIYYQFVAPKLLPVLPHPIHGIGKIESCYQQASPTATCCYPRPPLPTSCHPLAPTTVHRHPLQPASARRPHYPPPPRPPATTLYHPLPSVPPSGAP